ncbi:hypothetical protein BU16DRAFT_556016 [Lophium mytilinum]|uniref:Uncharacterized protein n=1 Tax=Lophium mytilinum TaxID=390894 RepID=A0A6A6RAZ2_9PEZI|nr:hypothetical protein BU16DRAFT_556016 [Lophium mytilinum]
MSSTSAMHMVEHPIVGLVTKREYDAFPTLSLRNITDPKNLQEILRGGLEDAAGTATRKICHQADESSPKRHQQAGDCTTVLPTPPRSTTPSPVAKTPTKTASVKTSLSTTPQRADTATMARRRVAHPTPPSEKKKSQYQMMLEAGRKAQEVREKKPIGMIVHKVESKEDMLALHETEKKKTEKRALEDDAVSPKTTKRKQTGSSALGVVPKILFGKNVAAKNVALGRTGFPDTTGRNKRIKEEKLAKERAKMEKERAKREKEAEELKAMKEREAEEKRKEEELFDELFG